VPSIARTTVRRNLSLAGGAIASVLVVACSLVSSDDPKFVSIEGTISSKFSAPLSSESTLVIELVDVTRGDALPDVIVKERIERPPNWPIHFVLSYDQRAVRSGHQYALSAQLYQGTDVVSGTIRGAYERRDRLPERIDMVVEPVLQKAPAAAR
jgi:uncharacterized lipoprotein YbaY